MTPSSTRAPTAPPAAGVTRRLWVGIGILVLLALLIAVVLLS